MNTSTSTIRRRTLSAALAVAVLAPIATLFGGGTAGALPIEQPPIPTEPEFDGGLQLVDQERLVDTRLDQGGPRLSALSPRPIDLSGDIPAAASAIAVNFTVVDPDGDGFVVAEAGGLLQGDPYCGHDTNSSTSSVNYYEADLAIANYATIPVGDDGVICVKSLRDTDVVIDLLGYWSEEDGGSAQSTTEAFRVFDTREQFLYPDDHYPLGRAKAGTVTWIPRGYVVGGGTPAAVSLTVTATESQSPGFLTAYPCHDDDDPVPLTSTLNTVPGVTPSNLTVVGLDATADVCVYTHTETAFIVDALGEWESGISHGFAPLEIPRRDFDTRDADGPKFSAGEERQVYPEADHTVVANLTATQAEGPGFLAAFPCDGGWDGTSTTNYGIDRANSSAVIIDASRGGICVHSHAAADVVFDVFNVQWRNGLAPVTVDLPGSPTDVVRADGHLWVAVDVETGDDHLAQLDTITGEVLATYPTPVVHTSLATDGTLIFGVDTELQSFWRFDPATESFEGPGDAGATPTDVVYAAGHLWITTAGEPGFVQKRTTDTGSLVATIMVGHGPTTIAYDGLHLWTANSLDGTVSKINPVAEAVMATPAVGGEPQSILFAASDVWVGRYGSADLVAIDEITNMFAVAGEVAYSPWTLEFDGTNIWMSSIFGDVVTEFDPGTNATVRTVGVGEWPGALEYDGTFLWVANELGESLTRILP